MKKIVLIGGGHTHAIVLRNWSISPEIASLTLISEADHAPYSGMLPGHISGFYQRHQCYIDLRHLSQVAHVNFIQDQAIHLDLQNNQVICANQLPVPFDILSIDIGSIPTIPPLTNPDLSDYIIPAKPIRNLLEKWDLLLTNIALNTPHSLSIAVVGGGVSGVELILAMQQRLLKVASQTKLMMHLVHQDETLLAGHSQWVKTRMRKILQQRQIQLYLSAKATAVISNNLTHLTPCLLQCESGLTIPCDYIFWVTQARAASWLKNTGLQLDDRGFILVKDTLQSISHPHIFAAGDIASMINYPRPKAGVFAVRQGPPLLANLINAINDLPLQNYRPQKRYLNLIGTADGKAIASRGNCYWESPLLWQLKDYIDRQFMQQFN